MPGFTFFPSSDAALLAFSLNFKTLIISAPTSYGLSAPLATAYGALHDAFAAAMAACEPSVRTKSATVTKNQCRTNLKNNCKLLANLVNGTATVTNAQKTALGLNVRAQPRPVPVPDSPPSLTVLSVSGWTVKIRLGDSTKPGKRGKAPGASGAAILSYVGTVAPTDLAQWKFESNVGRTTVDVSFSPALPGGTRVFLTAFWFNGRKQSGVACAPVSTSLQGGGVSQAA